MTKSEKNAVLSRRKPGNCKNLKKSHVPETFLRVFNSQQQDGKMESSFFVLSLEISFGGVFVGDWKDGKMES